MTNLKKRRDGVLIVLNTRFSAPASTKTHRYDPGTLGRQGLSGEPFLSDPCVPFLLALITG